MLRLCLALLLLTCAAASAQTPAPHLLMRALSDVQTQIVAGKAGAREEQARIVTDMARHFAATPAEAWRDPRNARVAIAWLLSGGSTRTFRHILETNAFPAAENSVARGVLAYEEGSPDRARVLLRDVDLREFDPIFGARIALVQSALLSPTDRPAAIQKLSMARLLAPGSLMEETALRRQIALAGEAGDVDVFVEFAQTYARRFSASLYAEAFRDAFVAAMAQASGRATAPQAVRLARLLDEGFPPEEKCRLATRIARTNLLRGGWAGAKAFADASSAGCGVSMRFYGTVAAAMAPGSTSMVSEIESFRDADLSADDQALRKASLHYVKLMRMWPEAETLDPAPADSALVLSAREALARSEILLQKGKR